MTDYEEARSRIDAIEAEMKKIGFWSDKPLLAEMYNFSQAFAMDTMPFVLWLQFIFIPRVRDIIANQGEFPRSSMVATQAIREFDGLHEASDLISLLVRFDSFVRDL